MKGKSQKAKIKNQTNQAMGYWLTEHTLWNSGNSWLKEKSSCSCVLCALRALRGSNVNAAAQSNRRMKDESQQANQDRGPLAIGQQKPNPENLCQSVANGKNEG